MSRVFHYKEKSESPTGIKPITCESIRFLRLLFHPPRKTVCENELGRDFRDVKSLSRRYFWCREATTGNTSAYASYQTDDLPCTVRMLYPQRSNAARVRKLNRFNGGKLPGNSKHLFKSSKDKAVPRKRSFKR